MSKKEICKKIMSLLLISFLSVSVGSCGDDSSGSGTSNFLNPDMPKIP